MFEWGIVVGDEGSNCFSGVKWLGIRVQSLGLTVYQCAESHARHNHESLTWGVAFEVWGSGIRVHG